METIRLSKKGTNEQVLERIGENRTLLNNILRKKANWTYWPTALFQSHDVISRHMRKHVLTGRKIFTSVFLYAHKTNIITLKANWLYKTSHTYIVSAINDRPLPSQDP